MFYIPGNKTRSKTGLITILIQIITQKSIPVRFPEKEINVDKLSGRNRLKPLPYVQYTGILRVILNALFV